MKCQENDCAVVGCERAAHRQSCAACGHSHHHGLTHYDCKVVKLALEKAGVALEFHKDGWHPMCDHHARVISDALDAYCGVANE